MAVPRTHYSLGHKVYLYLKDTYGLGFPYTVSIHLRLKISSIILYIYKNAGLFLNLQREVDKGMLVYIGAKWIMKC